MIARTETDSRNRAPDEQDRLMLVRAFTAWCGDPLVADDLAQESMYAAWTSRRQPESPAEWRPWLFGVARNILLRWRREQVKHGRRVASAPESERHLLAASGPDDLDALLARKDVVELLDAALGRLPRETRQALLLKYIDDLPQAEIAARMGIHEKALEGKLHRGKRAAHRYLLTERPDSALSLGLISEPDVWVPTDIWCSSCGENRLIGRWWESGHVRLDCPSCVDWAPWERSHIVSGDIDINGSERRPSFAKAMEQISSRFTALETDGRDMTMPCSRCGGIVRPTEHLPSLGLELRLGPDIRFECETCGHVEGFTWLPGTDSTRSEVRAWRAQYPRTMMLKPAFIRFQERDAIASIWCPVDVHDPLTIIHDLETWRVLHIDMAARAR